MAVKLYNYQLDAVNRMKNGCVLCGGVGTGKSRTALGYYYQQYGGILNSESYTLMHNPANLYIITTARKRDTLEWDEELIPFHMSTDSQYSMYTNQVVIDSWNNISKYVSVKNAFFIFDEQRVVGSGAWVKAFYRITKSNKWILLSATPGDTWSDYIPVFVANGFYRNKTHFEREHVVYKRFAKWPQIDKYINTNRLEQLRSFILVNMDFERKTTRHHIDILVQYDIPAYKWVMRERKNPETKKPLKSASELCSWLRRITNTDETRSMALLEILELRERAIIFYNFDYELEILRNLGYIPGTKVAEWNGHNHNPIPTGDRWVYLVQYTAGAEGWNCTTTDTVIFYSQTYSYKIQEQACGRIDRLNTPFVDLYYYHLRSHSGIELSISRALANKKSFNETKFIRRHTKNE